MTGWLDNGRFILNMLIIYLVALAVVRVMGKRALGELSLFDFVIMVGIGDVIVVVGLEQQVPLSRGLLILALLGALEFGFSLLTFRSECLSRLIEGTPTLLIKDGVLLEQNLAKEHISRADLYQELRKQGVMQISRVARAVLEACGKFSVILKDDQPEIDGLNLKILREVTALRRELAELNARVFFKEKE
jgi:uncharacterized membrane protein YcaP (DUF421 family)